MLHSEQEVDWSFVYLKESLIFNRWRTREIFCLTDKHVYEREREGHGQFLYHVSQLPKIVVGVHTDVRLSNTDDAIVVTRKAPGD